MLIFPYIAKFLRQLKTDWIKKNFVLCISWHRSDARPFFSGKITTEELQSLLDDFKTSGENYEGIGTDYRGFQRVTREGYKCKMWKDTGYKIYQTEEWEHLDLREDYCRNPVQERGAIWCNTDEHPTQDWSYCWPMGLGKFWKIFRLQKKPFMNFKTSVQFKVYSWLSFRNQIMS